MIEYIHITCQQDAFPYPEQVDPLRDIAIPYTQQAAGGAAGNILQFSAQTCFNALCQFHQFLQLFRSHRRALSGAAVSEDRRIIVRNDLRCRIIVNISNRKKLGIVGVAGDVLDLVSDVQKDIFRMFEHDYVCLFKIDLDCHKNLKI